MKLNDLSGVQLAPVCNTLGRQMEVCIQGSRRKLTRTFRPFVPCARLGIVKFAQGVQHQFINCIQLQQWPCGILIFIFIPFFEEEQR